MISHRPRTNIVAHFEWQHEAKAIITLIGPFDGKLKPLNLHQLVVGHTISELKVLLKLTYACGSLSKLFRLFAHENKSVPSGDGC